jgi:hypothetical protein
MVFVSFRAIDVYIPQFVSSIISFHTENSAAGLEKRVVSMD